MAGWVLFLASHTFPWNTGGLNAKWRERNKPWKLLGVAPNQKLIIIVIENYLKSRKSTVIHHFKKFTSVTIFLIYFLNYEEWLDVRQLFCQGSCTAKGYNDWKLITFVVVTFFFSWDILFPAVLPLQIHEWISFRIDINNIRYLTSDRLWWITSQYVCIYKYTCTHKMYIHMYICTHIHFYSLLNINEFSYEPLQNLYHIIAPVNQRQITAYADISTD